MVGLPEKTRITSMHAGASADSLMMLTCESLLAACVGLIWCCPLLSWPRCCRGCASDPTASRTHLIPCLPLHERVRTHTHSDSDHLQLPASATWSARTTTASWELGTRSAARGRRWSRRCKVCPSVFCLCFSLICLVLCLSDSRRHCLTAWLARSVHFVFGGSLVGDRALPKVS